MRRAKLHAGAMERCYPDHGSCNTPQLLHCMLKCLPRIASWRWFLVAGLPLLWCQWSRCWLACPTRHVPGACKSTHVAASASYCQITLCMLMTDAPASAHFARVSFSNRMMTQTVEAGLMMPQQVMLQCQSFGNSENRVAGHKQVAF